MNFGYQGIGFPVQYASHGGISYLLRDEFTTDRAAGAVNGTSAEPGPGTRTATDGNSVLTIASGLLTFATGGVAASNPAVWYGSVARVAGTILKTLLNYTSTGFEIGYDTAAAGSPADSMRGNSTTLQVRPNAGSLISVAAIAATTTYTLYTIARAAGVYHLIKGGAFTYPTLIFVTTGGAGALFPAAQVNSSTNVFTIDYMRIPANLWLPIPLASDGFASAFGTTDGLGHAETSGPGAGGNGVTWTQQAGTWTVASAVASASALSGGIAIATVPTSTADVMADIKLTRSAGQGGLVLRYTDANNYLYANHDGTNAFLKQVLAGVTTTLITAAATYSAGAVIRADLSGTAARLYYNNVLIGSTASINAALTATAHGLYVTDVTANLTVDDFIVIAKGTANEYAELDVY